MADSAGQARGRSNGRMAEQTASQGRRMPYRRGTCTANIASRMEKLNVDQAQKQKHRKSVIIPRTRPENLETSLGTVGAELKLTSNFFSIQGGPAWCIYEYRLDFDPEVDFIHFRRELLKTHEDKIGQEYIFDGGSNFFTPNQLGEENEWKSTLSSDNKTYKLRVRRTGEIHPESDQAIRILDIVIRQIQRSLGLKQHKRDFFDPERAITVPDSDLTIWPGYSMTIMKYERELLLNVDVKYRHLCTNTVYDLLRRLSAVESGNFKTKAEKLLVGDVVLTKYNNKTRRIDDILWPPDHTPESTCFEREGEKISIVDYLDSQYGIKIKDKGQPILVSRLRGNGRIDKLVPELCFMTGLTESHRKNQPLMKRIYEMTNSGPDGRIRSYVDLAKRVAASEQTKQILSQWNLRLQQRPLEVTGRLLLPVKIISAADSSFLPANADFSNQVKTMKLLRPYPLLNWALVYPRSLENLARDFCSSLNRIADSMGVNVGEPDRCPIENFKVDSYKAGCMRAKQKDRGMVVCLLANNNRQTYEAIKKFTLIDAGVPSQCVLSKNLERSKIMSVCTKLAHQINVKMGGSLWKVPLLRRQPLMICGFDTYHDSTLRGQSVGGFVATIDLLHTVFFSRAHHHGSRGELSPFLRSCLADALKHFQSRNDGVLPERILFYRDGVGDNQLQVVHDVELNQMKSAFSNFGSEYQPELAVIVVQKRIRPRFFVKEASGHAVNPMPGTVIDNTVTNPRCYEFYVIAQLTRRGTVTPTRYNIIHETTQLSPDDHHRFAYHLSHLYYNWPGAIRVVAPCHYAHKLAYLIGQHVHDAKVHRTLNDKLYYL